MSSAIEPHTTKLIDPILIVATRRNGTEKQTNTLICLTT